jgi:hypothetical protein
MGILAQSFGEQKKCAGRDRFCRGAISQMKVANDDKHGELLVKLHNARFRQIIVFLVVSSKILVKLSCRIILKLHIGVIMQPL